MPEDSEKCPFCSEPMELGWVAGGGVYWRKKEWGLPKFVLFELGEPLGPKASYYQLSLTIPHVPAQRCVNCRIVLIRYPKKETPSAFLKMCIKCGKQIPIASEECPFCKSKQT